QIEKAERAWESLQTEKPLEAERIVKRYQAAVAALERHQIRVRLRAHAPAILTTSEIRRVLEGRPELAQRIIGQVRWLAVLTAVHGGYANYWGDQAPREYLQIARFLQRNDEERE